MEKHFLNFFRRKKLAALVISFGTVMTYFFLNVKTEFITRVSRPELVTNHPKAVVSFRGRIGNHMFSYATLVGVSRKNDLIPVISAMNNLWDIFKIPIHTGSVSSDYVHIEQKLVGSYENIVENLQPKDTYLDGYWQSWKYFEHIKQELLSKHFVFRDEIASEADQFIRDALTAKGKSKTTTVVGVHIRRGDFVRQRLKGFTAAPVSYYYKGMNYFRRKYPNVLFIMISNDVFWAEDHLDQGPDVFYSHNTPDKGPVDLAILARCNHTLVTSGSFSWWAAYLNPGEVIYYHLYPQPNTKIGNQTIRADYYPPKWIPM